MEIDFNKTVYLQIGGEIGRNNSLPLTYFSKLAEKFQSLIDNIVENDLSTDESIAKSNFKLELSDFKEGSAVPGFIFTKNIHQIVNGDAINQRKQVSSKFENLMQIAHEGKYLELKKMYPEYKRRNEIVSSLYDFVDSIKTPQANFVRYENENMIPIYKLRKFKKSTRDSLIVKVVDESDKAEEIKYGKLKIVTKNGKQRKTIKQIYNKESTVLSHVFDLIRYQDKHYEFKTPLLCSIEKDEDGYIIESHMLGVVGHGITRDEAIEDFSEEFDYLYNRLQPLAADEMSKKMKFRKDCFNLLIKTIV